MALPEFRNEPFTDFSKPENSAAMEQALAAVRAEFGKTYPLIIGGERISTEKTIASLNPARPSEVVGRVASASVEQANRAIEVANATFASWRKVPAAQRADYVFKAAAELRRRKFEMAAVMVYEVSKSWAEADGDIAEAIDFCEFYAREMLRLAGPQKVYPMPGEDDQLQYVPLGAGVAIPPWNFPCAIMVGLVVAPMVAGNTIVLKPASTSPIIAAKFVEVLESVGVPPGVVNFVPGPGGSVGDALVDHPLTRFIAFTGSKEIGLRIFERAAKLQPGQKWLKRTVLEMGGKDTIVVDETADLAAAAEGIVSSAFGFQGQKCSACSRVVAVERVYDELLDRVVERAGSLTVGDPTERGTFMGAVIDDKSRDKIRGYIEAGHREGRLALGGEVETEGGYFVQPTIFADIPPDGKLSQEEIFGPVLAFIKAKDFDEALEIANNTEFGLTGGLYSQNRERLARARDDFHVGNLYLNRKITGAMVGAHPFGGFNMSGTDSKTGGPDYLLLYLQGKSIAEKL
ncbi:MAG TPA: L-glutamate gamma-semialdehyde dehydrogenase [Kouleothrix sp.]|uniref:L-glutamate gamma-semialdehyde dehydrogenase n=1 Tax=Kouleothrix sp. TaxID=2779161 RepID=UPI002BEE94F1|nr:L-glutamate gamma-semialdehyde dehydrogenase [Kouleothrix sp.]HRC77121.1 L-glutamate gamma-semialdehyde dehydrogenase [Kouleothrix sp.]